MLVPYSTSTATASIAPHATFKKKIVEKGSMKFKKKRKRIDLFWVEKLIFC